MSEYGGYLFAGLIVGALLEHLRALVAATVREQNARPRDSFSGTVVVSCIKCGTRNTDPLYKHRMSGEPEHLSYQCRVCRFIWGEAVLHATD